MSIVNDHEMRAACEELMRGVQRYAGIKLGQIIEFIWSETHRAEKEAFERGWKGGLAFALAVCDERGADIEHVKKRCQTAAGLPPSQPIGMGEIASGSVCINGLIPASGSRSGYD